MRAAVGALGVWALTVGYRQVSTYGDATQQEMPPRRNSIDAAGKQRSQRRASLDHSVTDR
jgi:hypothetical protein